MSNSCVVASALVGYQGESKVISREYFLRQAATLVEFARSSRRSSSPNGPIGCEAGPKSPRAGYRARESGLGSKAASVGGLFHSYQSVTTYSVSICSFSSRTAGIAVCVFKTAPGPSVARKSLISLSSLPGSPLLSNILTFIFEPPVHLWWPLYLGLDH